jgi:hypothetical protein
MGIQYILTKKGSVYTPYDGATPPTNQLATKASKLHATATGDPGYSLNGAFTADVVALYNQYNDGVNNNIPQPSILDQNGKTPAKYKNPETGTTYP